MGANTEPWRAKDRSPILFTRTTFQFDLYVPNRRGIKISGFPDLAVGGEHMTSSASEE